LIVSHKGKEKVFDFAAESAYNCHYIAFYADCQHEIKLVTQGYRLCLVYNLLHKRSDSVAPLPAPTENDAIVDALATTLTRWSKEKVYFVFTLSPFKGASRTTYLSLILS